MNPSLLSHCESFLRAHAVSEHTESEHPIRRAVTISRETGAGAISVGTLLAEYLKEKKAGDSHFPWAAFDYQLVEKIIKDSKLPASVGAYLREDIKNVVSDSVEDILGLHPSAWTLVHHTNRTILRLALAGNVVLIGRGANIVTSELPHVLHIRLIAPIDFRVKHAAYYHNCSLHDATEIVQQSDRARVRYVQKNFGKQVQDPHQYHLIVNTGLVGFQGAAEIIGNAVLNFSTASQQDIECRPGIESLMVPDDRC